MDVTHHLRWALVLAPDGLSHAMGKDWGKGPRGSSTTYFDRLARTTWVSRGRSLFSGGGLRTTHKEGGRDSCTTTTALISLTSANFTCQ